MSVFRAIPPTGDRVTSDRSLLLYIGESRSGVDATEWPGVVLDPDGMARGERPYFLGDKLSVEGGFRSL